MACISYIYSHSVALKDPKDGLLDEATGTKVVSFLVALHPLGGEDDEDRVLVEEVADQNTANFIVKPLLLLRPALTLGLVQLSHKL